MNQYLSKSKLHLPLQVLFFVILIDIDQLSKMLVVSNLKDGTAVTVIKGFAEFRYLENTGAAFGILENAMWFFYLITAVVFVITAVIWFKMHRNLKKYVRLYEEKDVFRHKTYSNMIFLGYILAALAAGAVGNLIDRVINGYVVDFIRFTFFNFPTFNFADICVTVSVVLLIIFFLFIYKEDPAFSIWSSKKSHE